MKRYLILCLLLALLLPCMIVPASATTQGVIDAIEDLQAGLGTSQRDIVDLLTSIDEWIYECYLQLVDIASTVYGSIYEGYCVPLLELMSPLSDSVTSIKTSISNIYKYFFVKNTSVKYYYIGVSGGKLNLLYNGPATVTGFQADLVGLENGLYSGFYRALDAIYQLLVGDTTASDEFEEDMIPIETEVDDWIDSMETAPTINVEDIETEVDKITDFQTDANYISILSSIFLNEAFLMMFTWSVIMAMLGYILFGKR